MRNTLPVKSAGLILEVPCRETDVDFLEVVGLREAFEPPPEEEDFRDPDPLIMLRDPRFPCRKDVEVECVLFSVAGGVDFILINKLQWQCCS